MAWYDMAWHGCTAWHGMVVPYNPGPATPGGVSCSYSVSISSPTFLPHLTTSKSYMPTTTSYLIDRMAIPTGATTQTAPAEPLAIPVWPNDGDLECFAVDKYLFLFRMGAASCYAPLPHNTWDGAVILYFFAFYLGSYSWLFLWLISKPTLMMLLYFLHSSQEFLVIEVERPRGNCQPGPLHILEHKTTYLK